MVHFYGYFCYIFVATCIDYHYICYVVSFMTWINLQILLICYENYCGRIETCQQTNKILLILKFKSYTFLAITNNILLQGVIFSCSYTYLLIHFNSLYLCLIILIWCKYCLFLDFCER